MLFNCLRGTGVWGYDKLGGIHISHRDISAKKKKKSRYTWASWPVGGCRIGTSVVAGRLR